MSILNSRLKQIEKKLGVKLPDDYVKFRLDLGERRSYLGLAWLGLEELYVFDEFKLNDRSVVPFAVDDWGNYMAFAYVKLIGRGSEKWRLVVGKVSHDPVGFAHVADTFGTWLKMYSNYRERKKEAWQFSEGHDQEIQAVYSKQFNPTQPWEKIVAIVMIMCFVYLVAIVVGNFMFGQ